jgi:hypothetical protein
MFSKNSMHFNSICRNVDLKIYTVQEMQHISIFYMEIYNNFNRKIDLKNLKAIQVQILTNYKK